MATDVTAMGLGYVDRRKPEVGTSRTVASLQLHARATSVSYGETHMLREGNCARGSLLQGGFLASSRYDLLRFHRVAVDQGDHDARCATPDVLPAKPTRTKTRSCPGNQGAVEYARYCGICKILWNMQDTKFLHNEPLRLILSRRRLIRSSSVSG